MNASGTRIGWAASRCRRWPRRWSVGFGGLAGQSRTLEDRGLGWVGEAGERLTVPRDLLGERAAAPRRPGSPCAPKRGAPPGGSAPTCRGHRVDQVTEAVSRSAAPGRSPGPPRRRRRRRQNSSTTEIPALIIVEAKTPARSAGRRPAAPRARKAATAVLDRHARTLGRAGRGST